MCGITGFWDTSKQFSIDRSNEILRQMSNALIHRGPDDNGQWADAEVGIYLGHRRLSIVDLSSSGHQPMMSTNGRYVITFNGEIYNFLELRHQLESLGHKFRGHSDTEVMLASFIQWGLHDAVERFNGMFAFALWDKQEGLLHLGRDRIGEKPLYYGFFGQVLLFASELKALKAFPYFQAELNRDALALYFQHNYVPAPYSIYKHVYKLPAGCILSWNGVDSHPNPIQYWCYLEAAQAGIANPFTGSQQEAVAQLEVLLKDAVSLRMIADVSLGAFLSGGIDSSTVVALMQAQSSQPVKTFTIGFYESAYNEAQYAKEVAKELGCYHTELFVTPEEALATIPKLPMLYDEPFSDPSQVPTLLVSKLTKQHVTVALSGDGGDELFAGYGRYFLCSSIWEKIGWIPPILRKTAANGLISIPPQVWNNAFALLPLKKRQIAFGDKLHKLAEVIAVPDAESMYTRLISGWRETNTLVVNANQALTALNEHTTWSALPDLTQRMMYFDAVTYLPDDILVKVDRASMGVSLESRIPFLDHRVVEFAWRLPLSMKIRDGQGKWLLRQLLYKYIPKHLIERPKMGFGIPIDSWLRGSLREWAEDLLDEHKLRQQGFLNPQPIRQKWAEHLSGHRNWQSDLWSVLMFQAWLAENKVS